MTHSVTSISTHQHHHSFNQSITHSYRPRFFVVGIVREHSIITSPLSANEDDERTITKMNEMTKEGPPAGTNAQNPIVVVTHSEQEVQDYVATMLSKMVRSGYGIVLL